MSNWGLYTVRIGTAGGVGILLWFATSEFLWAYGGYLIVLMGTFPLMLARDDNLHPG